MPLHTLRADIDWRLVDGDWSGSGPLRGSLATIEFEQSVLGDLPASVGGRVHLLGRSEPLFDVRLEWTDWSFERFDLVNGAVSVAGLVDDYEITAARAVLVSDGRRVPLTVTGRGNRQGLDAFAATAAYDNLAATAQGDLAWQPGIAADFEGQVRSGPNQAHLPLEDVPELRQLVERGLAQEVAEPGDPGIAFELLRGVPLGPRGGVAGEVAGQPGLGIGDPEAHEIGEGAQVGLGALGQDPLGERAWRERRAGARPVDAHPDVVVSPCDAVIGEFGRVDGLEVLQAKGFPYTIGELVANRCDAERYRDGLFVTLRLKSSMYHRFHAPCDGRISEVHYISGDTWNVNPIALKTIERLFCRNERAVIELDTGRDDEAVTLVPVAAILVASMRIHGLPEPLNLRYRGPNRLACERDLAKGDEIGYFEHGSTIIMFLKGNFEFEASLRTGETLRMGQPLLRRR